MILNFIVEKEEEEGKNEDEQGLGQEREGW